MNLPAKYPPISPKTPFFLHGGDYNPDQWMPEVYPGVWEEDMRLMKLAGCNEASVGIFSWASIEPEEGRFEFGWLDKIMDMLAKNGAFAVLATPSGARPAWMSQKYPEVLRVEGNRQRNLHGKRHNHCFSSPVYREKVRIINTKLAERYKDHPALIVWHVSNEYNGDCHCDYCQKAFRGWLRKRYGNDIEKLNQAWWTGFWAHRFNDFDQVESPSPIGEDLLHGHNLDWKRFVTDQTIDFFRAEIEPLKRITPKVPVTTNLMGVFEGLDYWKLAKELDVVSWDHYPPYQDQEDMWKFAIGASFQHDLNRSFKDGQPFMQMEMTPSMTNWMPVSKLKRPGTLLTEAMQSVAHGADTIQYFQWRKSRGSSEKFHGAVVDHSGHENTRVFREVAEVGAVLKKLSPVIGTTVRPEVGIIFDWENRWAIEDSKGPRNEGREYVGTVLDHYRPFWVQGVPVDVLSEDSDFSRYKLVIAPMLYMVRAGVGERLEKFVAEGGVLVTTYLSGVVNETDLCYLGGFPGPLRKVMGVWAEEIDAPFKEQRVKVESAPGNDAGLNGTYEGRSLVDLLHAEGAKVLATFGSEFYAGRPAVTVNSFGKGRAYYVASRHDAKFHGDFFGHLIKQMGLKRVLETTLPEGVTAQVRGDGKREYVFLLNFKRTAAKVDLGGRKYKDMISGQEVGGVVELGGYGNRVLERTV
ncbi:MAG: beta-galactosidase [Phycisphaeraceae bacterium]|nr:beta-galactosidase [Phycisphaeraceae bacterium]